MMTGKDGGGDAGRADGAVLDGEGPAAGLKKGGFMDRLQERIAAAKEGVARAAAATAEGVTKAASAAAEGVTKAASATAEGVTKAASATAEGVTKAASATAEGAKKAAGATAEVAVRAKDATFGGARKGWERTREVATSTSETLSEHLDTVSGKKILALVEERLALQGRYNDLLATKLEEALDRIAALEARLGAAAPPAAPDAGRDGGAP